MVIYTTTEKDRLELERGVEIKKIDTLGAVYRIEIPEDFGLRVVHSRGTRVIIITVSEFRFPNIIKSPEMTNGDWNRYRSRNKILFEQKGKRK